MSQTAEKGPRGAVQSSASRRSSSPRGLRAAERESSSRIAIDRLLDSGVFVGEAWTLEPGPPGLSRISGEHTRAPGGGDLTAVRVQLEGLSLSVARSSLSWLNERVAQGSVFRIDEREQEVELIEDPARIRGIAAALIATEANGQAMLPERFGNGERRLVPLRLARDGSLLWGAAPGVTVPAAPIEVQMQGFSSVYLFEIQEHSALSLPASMVRVRRRRFRRACAPRRLRFASTHPLWSEISIDAQVLDVSERGICIEADAVSAVLYPGLKLRSVVLRWKGGQEIRAEAVIAHVTPQAGSSLHRVGMRLSFDEAEAARWHVELEELLHPRTTRGEPDAATFWNTYVESGYFQLSGKCEQEFLQERVAFERAQYYLRDAPDLAGFFAYSTKRRTESVAHQASVWRGSWVYYQFCRRQEERPLSAADDNLLLDLYAHAYEHVQSRADARWLVTYVQEKARFSRLIFYDLAERYRAEGRACIWPFRALEVDCGQKTSAALVHDVGLADPSELSLLANRIRALRSPMYIEATGLGASDLSIAPTTEQWESAGLMRTSAVLIARSDSGAPIAGAVLDAVSMGIHLFGLLDVARLFPLVEGGAAAYDCLLAGAWEWFAKFGKRKFTYFADESEDPKAIERPCVTDLGQAFTTILPVGLLPELLEHVFCVTCAASPSGSAVELTRK